MFDDTSLAIAAVSAPEKMAKIKSLVLGRLDDLPADGHAVPFETFQAWLETGGSANDTAARIF